MLLRQHLERQHWHSATLWQSAMQLFGQDLLSHLVDTQLHEIMRIISGTLHATPLPWLPVLSHIPPPNLRRQKATAKLLTTIQLNDKLPLCSDINSHPSVRLLSRHPVWLNKPAPDATAASEWIDAWFNTIVVNQSLVTDPTICPPGFNLPWRLWSTLNRFRTGRGRCAANLVQWHQAVMHMWKPTADSGSYRQSRPITRFSGGL